MARGRLDIEVKTGHLYRFVDQNPTLTAFRVEPGEVVMVTLYRGLPSAVGVERGEIAVGKFTLDEALEYARPINT